MLKKYQSVPLVRGHDSTPYMYKAVDSDEVISFHKEYPQKDYYWESIHRKGIGIYHQIHALLSEQEYTLDIRPGFILEWKKYNGVTWSVVPLDIDGIFNASKVDTHKPILVTYPPYIAWKTLDQFDKDFEYDDCIGRVCTYWRIESEIGTAIGAVLKEKIGNNVRFNQIGWINIKVVKTGEKYLWVVVTDIANQLFSSFLWENEEIEAALKGK